MLNIVATEELQKVSGPVGYLGKYVPRRLSSIQVFKKQNRD